MNIKLPNCQEGECQSQTKRKIIQGNTEYQHNTKWLTDGV